VTRRRSFGFAARAAGASGQALATSPPAVRATVWLGGGAAPRSIHASKAANAVR
jgi:hypothetical protein